MFSTQTHLALAGEERCRKQVPGGPDQGQHDHAEEYGREAEGLAVASRRPKRVLPQGHEGGRAEQNGKRESDRPARFGVARLSQAKESRWVTSV